MDPIGCLETSCSPVPSDCDAAPPAPALPQTLLPPPTALAGLAGLAGWPAGDIGAALAALAVQNGQSQRWAATVARDVDEARAEDQAGQEVAAIRAQAGSIRAQAWFDAVTSVAQVAAAQSASGGSETSSATAAGTALGGVKALGDGLYSADEKDDEASARGYEGGVTSARFAADGAHDALSDAREVVQAALEFYKQYVATEAQTRAAALGGRG